MKKIIFCAVVFILAGLQVSAQTININKHFGKVSKEEVQMTTYQLDTAASALVLYEKQDVVLDLTATGEFILTRDVHMRIKVLKEDGIEWGNFEFMKYSASNVSGESVGVIEAGKTASREFAFKLKANGNGSATKWNHDNLRVIVFISTKEGDKWYVNNVVKCPKDGSVDFEYEN